LFGKLLRNADSTGRIDYKDVRSEDDDSGAGVALFLSFCFESSYSGPSLSPFAAPGIFEVGRPRLGAVVAPICRVVVTVR
jgi:hypothetical protein